jgi:hypothetical protein
MAALTNVPFSLFFKSALLLIEAQHVIWLRMIRLSAGGRGAERELTRMYVEKLHASVDTAVMASTALALGKPVAAVAESAISGYRKRVRKNRRRLA